MSAVPIVAMAILNGCSCYLVAGLIVSFTMWILLLSTNFEQNSTHTVIDVCRSVEITCMRLSLYISKYLHN